MSDIQLPSKPNVRSDCAWVLYQILECGRSSRDCLERVQSRHQHKDNAWVHEMTFGVLRRLPLLQSWLRPKLQKPLKGNKKVIEHLLLLGLYQIAFTRVAKHAAVAETVNAASLLGAHALKGLVNAILRTALRETLDPEQCDDPIIQSGLPKWLYNKIEHAYPEHALQVIENTNTPAPVWLRVNSTKISRDAYAQKLADLEIEYSLSEEHSDAIILKQRLDVTTLPGFEAGEFAIQDGAAQLAASYLNAQSGDDVLDCCAAPGGKTAHIIEHTHTINSLLALDSDERRLARVHDNMQRLGHRERVSVKCADALAVDTWWDGTMYQRILLDAPCSATGVIRRHPDIRWLRKASDIQQLTTIQTQMLNALWPLLEIGGTLLYATCSILPEENKAQIAAFLASHSDARLDPIIDTETAENPGRQILPGQNQMDGFYYARLVKFA